MILPDGFDLHRGVLAHVSIAELREAIAWEQRAFRMFGRTIDQPRLTAWYGDAAYSYSGQRHEPAAPPQIVQSLKVAVESLTGSRFNSVLANLYRDGSDSVAWHADDEPELGSQPTIASASFGAARRFAIRNVATRERQDVMLAHGDLLIMSGRSQELYEHSVPKATMTRGARINLTFRSVT